MTNTYTATICGFGYDKRPADRVRWFLVDDDEELADAINYMRTHDGRTFMRGHIVDGIEWFISACTAYYEMHGVWPEFRARVVGDRDRRSVWIEPVITDGAAELNAVYMRPAVSVPAPTSVA